MSYEEQPCPEDARTITRVYYKGVVILVLPHVYVPSDDTFLLLEEALQVVKRNDRVLEIGTGSGIIAKFLAKKAKCVAATDINPHAVKNARLNDVNAVPGHLFANLSQKFDLIVFNPPYLPSLMDDDAELEGWLCRAWNGGPTGREVIVEFLRSVSNYLAGNGKLLMVLSSVTGLNQTIEKMRTIFNCVSIVATKKFPFETLYVVLGEEPRRCDDRMKIAARVRTLR